MNDPAHLLNAQENLEFPMMVHSIALSAAEGPYHYRKTETIALCTAELSKQASLPPNLDFLLHEIQQNAIFSLILSILLQKVQSLKEFTFIYSHPLDKNS